MTACVLTVAVEHLQAVLFQGERGEEYACQRGRERGTVLTGRAQDGLTRIFAHHSETHFDLPLSCIGFSSSTWKGRIPLNQHHLLRLCIHICSPNPLLLLLLLLASSEPRLPPPCSKHGQGSLRCHGNNGQGQRLSFWSKYLCQQGEVSLPMQTFLKLPRCVDSDTVFLSAVF